MRRNTAFVVGALLAVAAAPELAAGQEGSASLRRQVAAMPLGEAEIRLDGRLDEPVWQTAPVASDFLQRQPREGEPASQRTEVRFLYGPDALYIGARMESDDPATIQAPVSRRDNPAEADVLYVSLDTWLDRRTAVTFGITAGGVRVDRYHPVDREAGADPSFDPVWQGRAHRDASGWSAEIRIPFTQLRFADHPEQVWGLNLRRTIPARNEEAYWALVPRQETGWASRFGELTGIRGIRPARRLELLPYVAADAVQRGEHDPADPFAAKQSFAGRVGADFKMGLGPNLTLEATVNPDFGQVEADPAVVNLSAFETFFPERRPFFSEGAQLLRGLGPAYFYSRRIGARPVGRVDADFVDFPESTTILGAAKLTGRLARGTSLGGLVAVTDREHARTWDATSGAFGRQLLSPTTSFLVLRSQQDLATPGSTVGLSLTGVLRDLDAGTPAAALLTDRAWAGGTDWSLRLLDGSYELTGYAGGSQVSGSPDALLRLQRSSARYYQRPDADHVRLDPDRTSLAGWVGGARLEKVSGRNWLWAVAANATSPGFEINDAGRLSQADTVFVFGNLRYRETGGTGRLREYSVGLNSENAYNFGGTRTFTAIRSDIELVWRSFWSTGITSWVDLRAESDRLTRGGPLMETGQARVLQANLANPPGSPTRWRANAYFGDSELGERTVELGGGTTVRPSPRWQLSLDPSWFDSANPRQFVTSLAGGTAATYGRRYVFATIDRQEVSLRTRLNFAVTPDLTVELYAEPFAASGRYARFGELPEAGARDLRLYGTAGTTIEELPGGGHRVTDGDESFVIPSLDFDLRSFRSNLVLRWEWRPGSTLFLVWQQDRFGELERRQSVGPRALGEVFDPAGDHRLVIKASYWIPWG